MAVANMGRFRRAIAPEERFWLRVWPRGDCWEYRGGHGRYGHGLFNPGLLDGQVGAHRWAYEAAKGVIPAGLVVDHLCGHGWCVRPSHLVATTARDNTLRPGSRSVAARNAAKTICPHGHTYTRVARGRYAGRRVCRVCQRQWARRKLGLRGARVWP